MKLTGILKEQVEKAETKEKKKSLIGGAGMELTNEDMEKVSGGGIPPLDQIFPDFLLTANVHGA